MHTEVKSWINKTLHLGMILNKLYMKREMRCAKENEDCNYWASSLMSEAILDLEAIRRK